MSQLQESVTRELILRYRDAIERELAKGLCVQCGSGLGPFTVVEFPSRFVDSEIVLTFSVLCEDCLKAVAL